MSPSQLNSSVSGLFTTDRTPAFCSYTVVNIVCTCSDVRIQCVAFFFLQKGKKKKKLPDLKTGFLLFYFCLFPLLTDKNPGARSTFVRPHEDVGVYSNEMNPVVLFK